MWIDRRRFLLSTAVAAAAPWACRRSTPLAPVPAPAPQTPASPPRPWLHPEALARFVDPLPIPPVKKPDGTRPDPHDERRQIPFYRVSMREALVRVHRDMPPTSFWTYDGTMPGPTFETRAGQPLLVEWRNDLPTRHFLPIDHTLCGAGRDRPDVRAIVHVHGAKAPPESDGYPEDWYVPGQSKTFYYPNGREATTLWYHDHAMGIERLNQYAGLLGMFLVRDESEDALSVPRGAQEIPLVLCDRMFYADGGLNYPISDIPGSPWVMEVNADAMLVNGRLYPFLEVEPRRYRLRVVNAANARFFYLSLSNGQTFHQIGTDQGLLPAPVPVKRITLAPAERADLIVDFTDAAGTKVLLQSQSFDLMQFRVAARAPGPASPPLPRTLRKMPRLPERAATQTRTLGLYEYEDPRTRSMLMLLDGKHWHEPVSEKPVLDSIEIWSFVNTTEDSHPIHLHLVRFQILDRQAFDTDTLQFKGTMRVMGPRLPPEPYEAGWKDTVRAEPGFITRIIVKFEGYTGRYVWHCHVLEHAANEMMRPFEVVPRSRSQGKSQGKSNG
jgi:spore coat protein A, manganese oxidase